MSTKIVVSDLLNGNIEVLSNNYESTYVLLDCLSTSETSFWLA